MSIEELKAIIDTSAVVSDVIKDEIIKKADLQAGEELVSVSIKDIVSDRTGRLEIVKRVR